MGDLLVDGIAASLELFGHWLDLFWNGSDDEDTLADVPPVDPFRHLQYEERPHD